MSYCHVAEERKRRDVAPPKKSPNKKIRKNESVRNTFSDIAEILFAWFCPILGPLVWILGRKTAYFGHFSSNQPFWVILPSIKNQNAEWKKNRRGKSFRMGPNWTYNIVVTPKSAWLQMATPLPFSSGDGMFSGSCPPTSSAWMRGRGSGILVE